MGSQPLSVHQHRKSWAGWCKILAHPGVQAAQPRCLHPLLHHRFVLSPRYKVAANSLWKNEQGLFFFLSVNMIFFEKFGNFHLSSPFPASPFPAQSPNLWTKRVPCGELYTLLPLRRLTKQQMKCINLPLSRHFEIKEKLLTVLLAAWFY